MTDSMRDSLPKDLKQLDVLIRAALEDPTARAKVERVLPPVPALGTRRPQLAVARSTGTTRAKRRRKPTP